MEAREGLASDSDWSGRNDMHGTANSKVPETPTPLSHENPPSSKFHPVQPINCSACSRFPIEMSMLKRH